MWGIYPPSGSWYWLDWVSFIFPESSVLHGGISCRFSSPRRRYVCAGSTHQPDHARTCVVDCVDLSFANSPLPVSLDDRLSIAPPSPLRGADEDSFAHHSVVERLPTILRRVLDENDLPPSVVAALNQLVGEIPATPLHPIVDPGAGDTSDWNRYVESLDGADWLAAPWFFVETYFYRRIVAAVGYLTEPLYHVDPFSHQKQVGLTSNRAAIRSMARVLSRTLRDRPLSKNALGTLLQQSLWGNRADLSLWAADDDSRGELAQSDDYLLADHREGVADLLRDAAPGANILVVADNAGLELVGDLCLMDGLLSGNLASSIHVHVKSHPTFVSDVVVPDVGDTVTFLRDSVDRRVQKLGGRLQNHLDAGRIAINHHFFWTSPLPLWQMPADVEAEMRDADLVILKGDANYRRLLGDRHWPYDTPLPDATGYVPTPTLALRTLKSEIAAGLDPSAIERASSASPDWDTNGEWGMIQLSHPVES